MKLNLFALALLGVSGMAYADGGSCYVNADPMVMGAPGPIKQFIVQGKHQCWSKDFAGYWSDTVEVRDATDCDNGHNRLKNMGWQACQYYQGKKQTDAKSIMYQPGKCSSLW